MATYDMIAKSYDQTNRMAHPLRQVMYRLWINACGDLNGHRVTDFGCGSGVSTRMIRDAGAVDVTGIDISNEMLEAARANETAGKSSITYVVGDMFQRVSLPPADVVASMLAVHYASTRDELDAYFTNASTGLVAGGRLIALLLDPDQSMPFTLEGSNCGAGCVEEREDGRVIAATLLDATGQTICETPLVYQWHKKTYEEILSKCGFVNVEWAKQGLEQTVTTILSATKQECC